MGKLRWLDDIQRNIINSSPTGMYAVPRWQAVWFIANQAQVVEERERENKDDKKINDDGSRK